MTTPLISAIIPTYNRVQNTINAIQSVINQTYKRIEIIVIDDESTDKTSDTIKQTFHNRIQLHHIPHSGVSYARNFGVNHCQGDYIAFLDSDDIWHPDKITKQVNYHHQNPQYLISQTQEIWIRKGKRVNPKHVHQKPIGDIFEPSLHLCTVTPSSVFIKTTFFLKTGGFDEQMSACEDYDLWLRMSLKHQFGLIDELLLTKYGGHEDQLSMKYKAMDRFRLYSLAKLLWSGDLNKTQERALLDVFIKKSQILINGMKKRNKATKEFEDYIQSILNKALTIEKLKENAGLFLDHSHFE